MKKVFIYLAIVCCVNNIQAQNVGIGTTIPSEKLQVTGNIKADTLKPNAIKLLPNAGAGKLLTSDAAGNANWAEPGGSVGFGAWGGCDVTGVSQYNPVSDDDAETGDKFGFSVAIDGNYAIIGSYLDDVGLNTWQGSVSIYKFDGTNWILMQKITDPTGQAGDKFGFSVSISGNHAIAGSFNDIVGANNDQGSASILEFNGTNWVYMQKITDATGAADDWFGFSVSISGNYAIVGAKLDDVGSNIDRGSASIYKLVTNNWVLMQKIADATGASNDFFGCSVSISGNHAIVGALHDDDGANSDQGSASFYFYNETSWLLTNKVTESTGSNYDKFGSSVAIFGDYAVIGVPNDLIGTNANQGSAYIYKFNAVNWVPVQKITEPNGDVGDGFGSSVSISGNHILVGAYKDHVLTNTDQGSATMFLRVGNNWQRQQYITDPAGVANDFFGFSSAIDGNTKRLVIGAYGNNSTTGKVIFGKAN